MPTSAAGDAAPVADVAPIGSLAVLEEQATTATVSAAPIASETSFFMVETYLSLE
jgi:hypothetical protein